MRQASVAELTDGVHHHLRKTFAAPGALDQLARALDIGYTVPVAGREREAALFVGTEEEAASVSRAVSVGHLELFQPI